MVPDDFYSQFTNQQPNSIHQSQNTKMQKIECPLCKSISNSPKDYITHFSKTHLPNHSLPHSTSRDQLNRMILHSSLTSELDEQTVDQSMQFYKNIQNALQFEHFVDLKFCLQNMTPKKTIRVATFNIENLYARYQFSKLGKENACLSKGFTQFNITGFTIHKYDHKRISAQAIIEVDADIICLQEVESLQVLDKFNQQFLKPCNYMYSILIGE